MAPPEPAAGTKSGSPARTAIVLLVVAALGVLSVLAARWWWREQELRPSTDDALVNANYVAVQPQVTGIVSSIAVRENESVRAGALLFEIDRRPFEQALNQAQSQLAIVRANVASDKATVEAAAAQVEVSRHEVDTAIAALTYAQALYDDVLKAKAADDATDKEVAQYKAQLDEATANLAAAKATLARDTAQLTADQERLGDPEAEKARIAHAQAAVDIAEINLGYTRVTASEDGHVTQFDLRVGQVVSAEETLFYLVESGEWWIDANYKETQIERIRAGMAATVAVDMYPGVSFDGIVESLSRGTAASFSLLPPENATGNWVKVTQRVTVRVRVKDDRPDTPLRKGASATVTIDTTKQPTS